jgi:hypothetical protein
VDILFHDETVEAVLLDYFVPIDLDLGAFSSSALLFQVQSNTWYTAILDGRGCLKLIGSQRSLKDRSERLLLVLGGADHMCLVLILHFIGMCSYLGLKLRSYFVCLGFDLRSDLCLINCGRV